MQLLLRVCSVDRVRTILMQYAMGGEIAPHGPNVTRHSVFSGPKKHSGKSSNLKVPSILIVNIGAEAINQDLLLLS